MMVLSWVAILLLSLSYWFQIWKIHAHKEVRDISLPYHVFLAIGFAILIYTAHIEDSFVFLMKQILTTIPVLIIIAQIIYHRKDRWHDDESTHSCECGYELEIEWAFCPSCGQEMTHAAN